MRPAYLAHLAAFASDLSGLKAVIDCSNGMAGLFLRDVLRGTGLRYTLMFDERTGASRTTRPTRWSRKTSPR